jgi:sirohydrochlorin ferrochelatase
MRRPPLAIIVAHGAPSDPEPLDSSIKALAGRVQALAQGSRIKGATLAKPGSLESALAGLTSGDVVSVYPFFMSAGWFVKKELPRRVGKASGAEVTYLTPFGLDGRVPSLCVDCAISALVARGDAPEQSVIVLAAHGSRSGRAAARAARAVASRMRGFGRFRDVRVGFVEEAPTIADVASGLNEIPAVCLPFFATTAGHVTDDIPEQLQKAGFRGAILPPIGEDPAVPQLLADAICAQRSKTSTMPIQPSDTASSG